MADGTRFHDHSPYQGGFIAGWSWRPHHAIPTNPFRPGSRPFERWRRGYEAGLDATRTRFAILAQRASEHDLRAARALRKERELRQQKADQRFGSAHNV